MAPPRRDSNLGLQGSPAPAVGPPTVKLFPGMFPGKALALRWFQMKNAARSFVALGLANIYLARARLA